MNAVRPEVVAAVIAGVATGMPAEQWDILALSPDEMVAAAQVIARQAIDADHEPPGLLALTLPNLLLLGAQGRAVGWLADQLGPLWQSRPGVPLAEVLKVLPAERMTFLRAELGKVGLTL